MSSREEAESQRTPGKGAGAEAAGSNPPLGPHRTGAGLSFQHCRAERERYCGRTDALCPLGRGGWPVPRSALGKMRDRQSEDQ